MVCKAESEAQAGGQKEFTLRASNPRRRRRGVRGAEGRDAEGVKGQGDGEWGGDIPLPSRLGGLEKRRKLSQWGPGQSPGEKRFYCFLTVSERHSLQRLLKINVVSQSPAG